MEQTTVAFGHNPFLLRDQRRGSGVVDAGGQMQLATVALTLYGSTTNHTHGAESEVRKIKHQHTTKIIISKESRKLRFRDVNLLCTTFQ